MTPEREAQMREVFEKWWLEPEGFGLRAERFTEPGEAALAGFLACARALEPMVRDAELYQWLRSQYLAVDFDWQGQCALVFKIPQNTRVSADCDATIKAAMSAALEDGK